MCALSIPTLVAPRRRQKWSILRQDASYNEVGEDRIERFQAGNHRHQIMFGLHNGRFKGKEMVVSKAKIRRRLLLNWILAILLCSLIGVVGGYLFGMVIS